MFPGIAGIAGFAGEAASVDTSLYGVLAYRTGTDDTSGISEYNAEAYDVGGWHDNSSDPNRLTVPSGVSYARAIVNNRRASGTISDILRKGGTTFAGHVYPFCDTPGGDAANAASAIVAVSATNYFDNDAGGNTIQTDIDSWFAAEAISPTLKMCLLAKGSNEAIAAGTTTIMTWTNETRDTDAFHTPITGTITVTIASPAVVSWTSHGLNVDEPVVFTTTGALPTGITAGTPYYIISTGFGANSFRISTTPGGAAVNTSGSQSGVHTGTNTSRVVVPSGVSLVRISAALVASSGTGAQLVLSALKNGASAVGLFSKDVFEHSTISAVSAILAVSTNDYFECRAFQTDAVDINADDATWFQIEEIAAATKYALVNKSGTQAISATTFTALAFGAEAADTTGFHDNSSNNSRLTIPSGQGITQARLSFNVITASTAGQFIAEVRKNGSSTPVPGLPKQETDTAGTDSVNGFGAWLDVTDGDYFEVFVFSDNGQTLPVDDRTWFCIETR